MVRRYAIDRFQLLVVSYLFENTIIDVLLSLHPPSSPLFCRCLLCSTNHTTSIECLQSIALFLLQKSSAKAVLLAAPTSNHLSWRIRSPSYALIVQFVESLHVLLHVSWYYLWLQLDMVCIDIECHPSRRHLQMMLIV